ncbi:MAG: hypothetical protein Q4C47_02305, partial [Planctomycetia bacterium]|nr:hypothetical protein [Planctomycetia bacterium]
MRYGVPAIFMIGLVCGQMASVPAQTPEAPLFPAPDPAFVSEIPVVPGVSPKPELPPPLPPLAEVRTVTLRRPVELTGPEKNPDSVKAEGGTGTEEAKGGEPTASEASIPAESVEFVEFLLSDSSSETPDAETATDTEIAVDMETTPDT